MFFVWLVVGLSLVCFNCPYASNISPDATYYVLVLYHNHAYLLTWLIENSALLFQLKNNCMFCDVSLSYSKSSFNKQ